MKKPNKVTDTSLYSAMINLTRTMIKSFKESQKFMSIVYGRDVISRLKDMFMTLKQAFENTDKQEKLKYAQQMSEQLRDIEYLAEITWNVTLNFKKTECLKLFGELNIQINSWISSLKK